MIHQKIALRLKKIPGVDAIWLVGLKRKTKKRSFDLIASCNGSIEDYADAIINELREEWPNGKYSLCDDSVRISIPGSTGGVAVYDTGKLKTMVQDWIDGHNLYGEHRPWATVYWIPEALCGDLVTARSLYDPRGIHELLCHLLTPYPLALSSSVCRFCKEEIDEKIQALSFFSKKQRINLTLAVSNIGVALVRYAFSRSRIYLRGFKDLEGQSKKLTDEDMILVRLAEQLSLIKIFDDKKGLAVLAARIKEATLT